MKHKFPTLIIVTLLLLATGCSDDFLYDEIESGAGSTGLSTIYISPDWEARDYRFFLTYMSDVAFKIEETPSWFHSESATGRLSNSIGTIRCWATKKKGWEEARVYFDKMKVSANGQIFFVPIYYIAEGNPSIQVERTISVSSNFKLHIQNTSDGVLVCDVVSLPDWITDRTYYPLMIPSPSIISPYSSTELSLALDRFATSGEKKTGVIVLRTNDKLNPTVEINVTVKSGR